MRILVVTSLYSTPSQPSRSPPNARIVRAMKRHATVRVVAPLPYYPDSFAKGRPGIEAITRVPNWEADFDGELVSHPRYLHIPKVGRILYPALYAASTYGAVRDEVDAFRPDVIFTAWAFPDGVAAISIARFLGIPAVMRVMGSDVNAFQAAIGRRVQIAWALKNAKRVISVSAALKGACEDIVGPTSNVDVIPTGVDTKVFRPFDRNAARERLGLDPNARIVVVPARLAPEKGVSYFVDALKRLGDDTIGVLVGDGGEEPRLRAQAERLGVTNRLVFAGYRPEAEMPLFYSAADLVCLPSTEEGWPNVLIESFACGCPWVASDVGGVAEVGRLADGGMLAAPADPADLSRALRAALGRTWDRDGIAERGRTLTLEETGRRYVDSCAAALETSKRAQSSSLVPALSEALR